MRFKNNLDYKSVCFISQNSYSKLSIAFNRLPIRNMALELVFNNVPNDADVTITPEDMALARSIGILTPREVVPSDFVPAKVSAPSVPSWANRVSGSSAQKSHDDAYLSAVREADFLAFVDAHQTFLDDGDEIWDEATSQALIGHPCEMLSHAATIEVRVTAIKNGYYLGSIGGQGANVYIKTQLPLEPHSLYMMDIIATPFESFPWRATKVYPKLPTATMLESRTFSEEPDEEFCATWKTVNLTYRLPTPAIHIGSMIGRQGKNISALIAEVNSAPPHHVGFGEYLSSSGEPEITITPTDDFAGCIVSFHQGTECTWHISDTEWLISHFHC